VRQIDRDTPKNVERPHCSRSYQLAEYAKGKCLNISGHYKVEGHYHQLVALRSLIPFMRHGLNLMQKLETEGPVCIDVRSRFPDRLHQKRLSSSPCLTSYYAKPCCLSSYLINFVQVDWPFHIGCVLRFACVLVTYCVTEYSKQLPPIILNNIFLGI